MRYGTCGNLTAKGLDITGIETVETVKEAGFDYIEMPLGEMMSLDDQGRAEIKERIDRAGIKSEVINNFFPREMKLTGPAVNREKIREYYKKALPYAKDLGAETVVFGSPFAKSYPLGFDKAEALKQLTDLTAEVDAYAAEIGVLIVVEPIHSFESNLINSFTEGVALVNEIHAKSTKVLIDYYHLTRDKEPVQHIAEHKEYLAHVHFACPFYPGEGERVFPLDQNEWDYAPFVDAIRETGYNGRVSIEARTSNLKAHAPVSCKLLHTLFD